MLYYLTSGHRVDMGQKKRVVIESVAMLPSCNNNSLKRSFSHIGNSNNNNSYNPKRSNSQSSNICNRNIDNSSSLPSSNIKKSRIDRNTSVIESTPIEKIGSRSGYGMDRYTNGDNDYLTYSNSIDRLSFSPFAQMDRFQNDVVREDDLDYSGELIESSNLMHSYDFGNDSFQIPVVRSKRNNSSLSFSD